jgi:1,4-alpha-glucan branching enzyme
MEDMEPTPSSLPGMGPRYFGDGTSFRVWAPHAARVGVTGSFNGWSATGHPLAREGDGYWSADVPEAVPGDQYKYVITTDTGADGGEGCGGGGGGDGGGRDGGGRDGGGGDGGGPFWRIDPYSPALTSSIGNSVVPRPDFDWGHLPFHPPARDELVIYELHVGTFNDTPGGGPGQLDAIVERLPHLLTLGVNAIQLMPPTEFPGGFSWGYNPSSPFAVESDYGGPEALKRLVRAAHGLGIAVFVDVVYNHLGPSDLGLWQYDGWSKDGKGGIYFYNDDRSNTPWGENNRPDYGRAEVRQYLRDNALSWLLDYRTDGLRWDATAYIRNVYGGGDAAHDLVDGWNFMRWVNDEIDAVRPDAISIAEDLRDNRWVTTSTGSGGAGFDTQWDAQFVHPVRAALIAPDDASRDVDAVVAAIEHRYTGAFSRVVYTESHDETANGRSRVPEEIWPGNADSWPAKKRSTLGAALVFTVPGVPMLFQGQEMLEDKYFNDDDPLDWAKLDKYPGIFQLYRDLISLRRDRAGCTRGLRGEGLHVHHVNRADRVVAFHRYAEGGPRDSTVVVINLANRSYTEYKIGLPRTGLWQVRFSSDWAGYDPEFGNHPCPDVAATTAGYDGMPAGGNVGLGPYTAVILSQDS